MKIYIVERIETYQFREPEVFLNGNKAFETVRKEYEEQMQELGTSQETSDMGYGNYCCTWNIDEEDHCGTCTIEEEYGCDRWHWRITEHEIPI